MYKTLNLLQLKFDVTNNQSITIKEKVTRQCEHNKVNNNSKLREITEKAYFCNMIILINVYYILNIH